jgi:hypothetical protein
MTRAEILEKVTTFIREQGIGVVEGPMFRPTLVPGIDMEAGTLRIEVEQMCEPADLLHEAAHIALTPRERWSSLHGTIESSPADEVCAIAWTWAAAMFLKIAPERVFHEEVISGNGPTLFENFSAGRYVGVPMLQRWGLTLDARAALAAGLPPYPHMLRWLREP